MAYCYCYYGIHCRLIHCRLLSSCATNTINCGCLLRSVRHCLASPGESPRQQGNCDTVFVVRRLRICCFPSREFFSGFFCFSSSFGEAPKKKFFQVKSQPELRGASSDTRIPEIPNIRTQMRALRLLARMLVGI
jgi:hypothetical protein